MSWSAGLTAIGAGVVARKRREIIQAYRSAGAVSADRSRRPQELGFGSGVRFHGLRRHGVLVETEPGRYFLDERREAKVRKVRQLLVLGVLAVAGVIAVIAVAVR